MNDGSSVDELRFIIDEKKSKLEKIKAESKTKEKSLQTEVDMLNKEKSDLMAGVQARIQLIDMLKRDIIRMAYEETARISQNEFDNQTVPKQ